ncbi:MAG: YwaF family protein [Clostridia bacterium]|nr:YwaF family protein [Clostridia bacterium]
MRSLFQNLFKTSHFNTGISITAFSVSHIVYLILIIGGIVGGYLWLRKKEETFKVKALNALAIALVVSYISDFFMHDFVYGDGLNMDKLPFHICTVLCPIVAFTQLNKKFAKFKEPVVMLSIIAPMMYIVYPASIGSGEPWCYQAVQTMFYHGVLMAWGILNVCLGIVKPEIKNIWKSVILLVCITLWAKLGNSMYEDYNWFFLEEDAFYIGLVENGIIPKWLLMVINPIVFTMAVAGAYGVIILVNKLKSKKA